MGRSTFTYLRTRENSLPSDESFRHRDDDPQDDYVEIELVRGSGRFIRVPRRRGPLERLRARLRRPPR